MTQLQLLSFFERQALRGGEASCALEERSLSLYTRIASKLMKAAKVAPSWLQEKQNGKRTSKRLLAPRPADASSRLQARVNLSD